MALIFLDLETTGLDPAKGCILEVAALRVDPRTFEPVDGFGAVIDPAKSGVTTRDRGMDDYVRDMHTKNGLLAELPRGHSFMTVYDGLQKWLRQQAAAPGELHTLAGDSVHFDRAWLLNEMPHVAAMFSHRLLDVSAFTVARQLLGLPPCDIAGGAHRAQSDVLASVAKAKWHLSRVSA